MADMHVKFPLRPTLLVIAGEQDYEARSLAEKVARTYAGDMRRLTEKFSQRHWDIVSCDINDKALLQSVWKSMDSANMAIITGYRGTDADNEILSKIICAASPLTTLAGLGSCLKNADLQLFTKSFSLLPQGLDEQFATTNAVLKQTRQENTWEKWDAPGIQTATGHSPGEKQNLH